MDRGKPYKAVLLTLFLLFGIFCVIFLPHYIDGVEDDFINTSLCPFFCNRDALTRESQCPELIPLKNDSTICWHGNHTCLFNCDDDCDIINTKTTYCLRGKWEPNKQICANICESRTRMIILPNYCSEISQNGTCYYTCKIHKIIQLIENYTAGHSEAKKLHVKELNFSQQCQNTEEENEENVLHGEQS